MLKFTNVGKSVIRDNTDFNLLKSSSEALRLLFNISVSKMYANSTAITVATTFNVSCH